MPASGARSVALEKLAGLSDGELRAMGEAESTTRNKNSRVDFFKQWLQAKGESLPVAPEAAQRFAAFMVQCEYTSVAQYTSSVIVWLCEPVPAGEQQRLLAGPAVLRAIANAEAAIARTIESHDPKKAPPTVGTGKIIYLPQEEKVISVFWFMTGLRGDSFTGIMPEDVEIKSDKIDIRIREDKVRAVRGRTIAVPCNCGTGPKKAEFCPIHGPKPIKKSMFPVAKTTIKSIHKKLGTTNHSFRRGFSLAVRQESVHGKMVATSETMARHMGWEEKARMWDEYTADYTKSERNMGWEEQKFIPLHGFRKLWAKNKKKDAHEFREVRKAETVDKKIAVTPAETLAKKGKVRAKTTFKSVKSKVAAIVKKALQKSKEARTQEENKKTLEKEESPKMLPLLDKGMTKSPPPKAILPKQSKPLFQRNITKPNFERKDNGAGSSSSSSSSSGTRSGLPFSGFAIS